MRARDHAAPSHVVRRTWIWLGVALAVILSVKLAVLFQLGDHPLLQPSAAGGLDSQYYLQLAQRVARGDLLLAPGLYFVSPLYIYFLAALLSVGGGSLFLIKVVQVTLGTVACALIWFTAREWFSTRAAWVALALSALTGAFTFYEILILQAALDPFLTALDLVLLTLAVRRPGWGWAVASGAAIAVHSMNRPNMLLVAAGLACALLARRDTRRTALIFVAGGVLAFMPLSMRNLAAAGTLSPVPSHGGLNFYIGNNPAADGTYHGVPGIRPNISGQAEDARRIAERAERRRLTDSEVSSYFTRRAIAWWRANPRPALRLFARKLAYTLSHAWLTLNYSYPFYRDESPVLQWLMIDPLLLVPLGIVGLFSHRLAGTRVPEGFLAWAALIPSTVFSIAAFFVASRYRVPLLVPLCVTAGGFVDAAWAAFGSRRVIPLALAGVSLAALFVTASADYGLDAGRGEEETQMALALIDRADWSRAQTYIARATADHPDPARVHLRLGEAFVHANRPADVIKHLEAARRLGRQDVRSTYDLAVAYGQAGRLADVARTLGRIRADEVRDPEMREALADAFMRLGLDFAGQRNHEQSIAAFTRALDLSPNRPSAHLNLAVAYAEGGETRRAREEALRALALDPSYQRAKDLLSALPR